SGGGSGDFALVANMMAPPDMPLMSAPDVRESADQALRAAMLMTDSTERMSLLRAISEALGSVNGGTEWVAPMKAELSTALAAEERIDRDYTNLRQDALRAADRYARAA